MATVQEVANHFRVDRSTVRRWLTAGCPCLRKGTRGPGGGAVLDLQAVAVWRGRTSGPAGPTVDELMDEIAAGCLATITEARADLRVNIRREDAAAVALILFEQIGLRFGRRYRLDDLPEPIRALMREL